MIVDSWATAIRLCKNPSIPPSMPETEKAAKKEETQGLVVFEETKAVSGSLSGDAVKGWNGTLSDESRQGQGGRIAPAWCWPT